MEAKRTILWIYYFSVGLMLVALSFSNYFMSVAQFCLIGVMILDGIRKKEVDDFFNKGHLAYRIVMFIPMGLLWIL